MASVGKMDDGAIRRAGAGDAPAIAAVHVAAWRESYAGLLPARLLRSLSVEEATAKWRQNLADRSPAPTVLVALRADRTVAGFGACGPQRTATLQAAGLEGVIEAIYLLQADQGRGLGRRLMIEMARALAADGLGSAGLWVLRDNQRARGFYEALGGELVGERVEMRGKVPFQEVAYGWPDLRVLLRA
jgi:ribosomal protein S18 acetylase RimI-like enzyme